MKLIVSSFVCVAFVMGCERQPPPRPTPPRAAVAPAAPVVQRPAALDAGALPEIQGPLPQTPEALAAYARIDAGVPSADGGPNPITGYPSDRRIRR